MDQIQLIERIFEKNNQIHPNLIKMVVEEIILHGPDDLDNHFCFLSQDCLNKIVISYHQLVFFGQTP